VVVVISAVVVIAVEVVSAVVEEVNDMSGTQMFTAPSGRLASSSHEVPGQHA
jgi:hypothetical protein